MLCLSMKRQRILDQGVDDFYFAKGNINTQGGTIMKLQTVLDFLYSEEQNVQISSFWDGGWEFKLGDQRNGFQKAAHFDSLDEGADWLLTTFEQLTIERANRAYKRG